MKLLRNSICVFVWLALTALACAQAIPHPTLDAERTQLWLQDKLLLDARQDGFFSLKELRYAPDARHFVVLACGYECNDNLGFLFKADGSGKRQFTARWDYILQSAVEWSADGRKLYYFRINSSGAQAPRGTAANGWVEVDVQTGRKRRATTRRLPATASYTVINLRGNEVLPVRAAPGSKAKVVGSLPPRAQGLKVVGASVLAEGVRWVRVQAQGVSGWVNQNYLCAEP